MRTLQDLRAGARLALLAASALCAAGARAEPPVSAWPGATTITSIDVANSFPSDLSGLAYEPATATAPPVLWALQSVPTRQVARLARLSPDGVRAGQTQDPGRVLLMPDGRGSPDTEDLALLPDPAGVRYVYVAIERLNDGFASRQSVLRYDTHAAGTRLLATHEWNLTREFPEAEGNAGIEALAYVPDGALRTLRDDATGKAYAPAAQDDHAGGLFFVGMETTGMVYAYALDHAAGTQRRVASFASGLPGVMELDWDADNQTLWAWCDNTCGNRAALLRLVPDASGLARFTAERILTRPSDLPNANNEGLTLSPESECRDGKRNVFWATDGAREGHAVWRGTVACGRL